MELGTKVKCKITGITGQVVARAEYLHAPPQVAIPKPGSMENEWVWFAETAVESVE